MNETEQRDALRAGRLLLATADGDHAQVTKILFETMSEPGPGVISLVMAVCSVSIECAQMVAGDDWRAVMSHALHDIELTTVVVATDPGADGKGVE